MRSPAPVTWQWAASFPARRCCWGKYLYFLLNCDLIVRLISGCKRASCVFIQVKPPSHPNGLANIVRTPHPMHRLAADVWVCICTAEVIVL